MRRRNRRDENQADVARWFMQAGCSVLDLSRVGDNCPDLLVARNGATALVEVKSSSGKLSGGQAVFRQTWKGRVCVVRYQDQVVDVVKSLV